MQEENNLEGIEDTLSNNLDIVDEVEFLRTYSTVSTNLLLIDLHYSLTTYVLFDR
jgi:hypothetical protein